MKVIYYLGVEEWGGSIKQPPCFLSLYTNFH